MGSSDFTFLYLKKIIEQNDEIIRLIKERRIAMYKKLERLDEHDMAELIKYMLEDMKENNMAALYNKYMDKINDIIYHISAEEAREIVHNMQPYNEMFSMDIVREMIEANNIPYEDNICVKYYLCMNMYANDAKQVADETTMPLEKFCFCMAKAFINDVDGGKYKVGKYFKETIR